MSYKAVIWRTSSGESRGDLITLLFAHEVGALRYRMTEAERDSPVRKTPGH